MLGPYDFTFVLFSCQRHSEFFPTCPLVSQYTLDALSAQCSVPDDFALVSHLSPQLSPTSLWILCPHDFRLGSHLSPNSIHKVSSRSLDALSALVRSPSKAWMLPTCVPLHSGSSACVISHLSPTCPHCLWSTLIYIYIYICERKRW